MIIVTHSYIVYSIHTRVQEQGCLLHGPWGYVISQQPQCASIRIDAFEQRVTWCFVMTDLFAYQGTKMPFAPL